MGLLVMVGFSLRREYNARYRFYRRSSLSRALARDLLRLSVPGGVATVAVMSGFLLFTKIVAGLDAQRAFAANGAATTIIIEVLSVTFFSCLAFGTATAMAATTMRKIVALRSSERMRMCEVMPPPPAL